jgi:NADH dehydrogenase
VIHLVGIIMERPHQGQTFEKIHVESTNRLISAASHHGVKRWIHMSALGTRPNAVSRYHQSKWRAEEHVRESDIPFTIIRPSIIHGHDGEFMQMVKGFCRGNSPPFLPYFGSGLFGQRGGGHVQPAWVEDVARCFVDALSNPATINETYPLGGPEVYTWPQLYTTCQRYIPGANLRKKPKAVPVWLAKLVAGKPLVPFNRDQVIMSQEDSTCQTSKVEQDFNFKLAPFEPTFAEYAAKI